MKTLILITLLLLTLTSTGQSIDVEKEKFPGIQKLTVKSFNGCCSMNGYRVVYYFDNIGNVIRSLNYFKKKHLANFEYRYNDKGLLMEKIQTYDIDNKSRIDTIRFTYEFDTSDRITLKTEHFGKWKHTESYQDFDANNNPQTVLSTFGNRTTILKRTFNSQNKEILKQRVENDSTITFEEIKYNEVGDIINSNIPSLLDKETGKMAVLIGGNRHSIVEIYEYRYDKLFHWTQKYVVFDNKKVLLEKRIYK
jgi:hypothetical protein